MQCWLVCYYSLPISRIFYYSGEFVISIVGFNVVVSFLEILITVFNLEINSFEKIKPYYRVKHSYVLTEFYYLLIF